MCPREPRKGLNSLSAGTRPVRTALAGEKNAQTRVETKTWGEQKGGKVGDKLDPEKQFDKRTEMDVGTKNWSLGLQPNCGTWGDEPEMIQSTEYM
jgi:hypothetical protein